MVNNSEPATDKSRQPLLLLLTVVLSLCVRLVNLHSPLVEYHSFRQTQTAITVWTMVREGISVWDYQTPVFGTPWQAPFEFPTFQITAALVAKTGLHLDVACRVTGLLYFYLSAWILYRCCCLWIRSRSLRGWIIGFYLWCPYTIVWSRTCMIDFASVAFALGYLYFLLIWLRDTRRVSMLAAATFCGCLAYLTKITTVITALPAICFWSYLYISGRSLQSEAYDVPASSPFGTKTRALLTFVLLVPVIAGLAWIKHRDSIIAQSVYTAWLSSNNLKTWNYGSLTQRLHLFPWRIILERLLFLLTAPLIFAGIWQAARVTQPERAFFWTACVGAVLPIFVFFNLYYVHDYYLIAIMPFIAIMAGYGLHALWQGMPGASWLRIAVLFCSLAVMFKARYYLISAYKVTYNDTLCVVGKSIQSVTPENHYVLIADYDWNPGLLYYARRKGWMLTGHSELPRAEQLAEYTTLVCVQPHPELLSLWKYHRQVSKVAEFTIFRVSNTPINEQHRP